MKYLRRQQPLTDLAKLNLRSKRSFLTWATFHLRNSANPWRARLCTLTAIGLIGLALVLSAAKLIYVQPHRGLLAQSNTLPAKGDNRPDEAVFSSLADVADQSNIGQPADGSDDGSLESLDAVSAERDANEARRPDAKAQDEILRFDALSTPYGSGANDGELANGATHEPMSNARQLVLEGEYYRRNGDYETAAQRFVTVIARYAGTPEAADAYLGLAETYYLDRQFKRAIETLQEFLQQFPYDPRVDRTLFFIANNYRMLGEWGGAIYYYEHYANRAEILRGYAYLFAGEAYFQAGNFAKAIQSSQAALNNDLPRVARVKALEVTADAHFWRGDHRTAIKWYRELLPYVRNAVYRADILYRIGRAYAEIGAIAEAENAWGEVIENYPNTEYALKAVESLPKGSNPPTHFYQGLVYYNHNRLDAAIAAFNEYLRRHPDGEDVPLAHYYLALAYRDKGEYAEALLRLDTIVNAFPAATAADDALWQSARLVESLSRYEEAIRRYSLIARDRPSSAYRWPALFRRGFVQYKIGDFAGAAATWLSLASADAEQATRARFWIGKALLKEGKSDAARESLAIAAAASGYYAARARSLLTSEPFGRFGEDGVRIRIDDAVETEQQNELERWLLSWSGVPPLALEEKAFQLRRDAAFRRFEELIRVGSWDEAQDELEELYQRYGNDPLALYHLATFLRQNGLYATALSIAADIVNLSPVKDVTTVPPFLQKMIYPLYYRELLLSEAGRYSIDPLLLAATIRQESKFDRNAESPAAAKGLMQIMPATGKGIAKALGMEEFSEADLFKPYISVAFGSWYLWNQLKSFGNDAFLALAAYNAGGGSVARWIGEKWQGDDDVFVEDIDFAETRAYIESIYQQYEIYRQIYRQ